MLQSALGRKKCIDIRKPYTDVLKHPAILSLLLFVQYFNQGLQKLEET